MEVIGDSLAVDRPRALALLAKQPALLYDFNRQTIAQRLDGLAATFGSDVEEVRGQGCCRLFIIDVGIVAGNILYKGRLCAVERPWLSSVPLLCRPRWEYDKVEHLTIPYQFWQRHRSGAWEA